MNDKATEKTQNRIKNMNLSDKYRLSQRKGRDKDTEIKLLKKELSIAQDFIGGLTQEIFDVNRINKDLRNRFINGGLTYTINNGMVSGIGIIQPVSEFTYYQEQVDGMTLDKLIGIMKTPLYKKMPFVYELDRQLRIDRTKYNKYLIIGGIL